MPLQFLITVASDGMNAIIIAGCYTRCYTRIVNSDLPSGKSLDNISGQNHCDVLQRATVSYALRVG